MSQLQYSEFNINNFNNKFLSFDKQYEQIKLQEREKEEKHIIDMFNLSFPKLNYNELQHQKSNICTDDYCTHYRYSDGTIYSWNFREKQWEKQNKTYAASLIDLFD